jgi:acetate---CoA ligase (ADP-forming)
MLTSPREDVVFTDITGLLYPRSIAVIGASDRPGNLGGDTVERLLRFGYPGPVWAVNPSGGTVRGLPCHGSLAELPEAPDSAVMAIPAAAIIDTVRECVARGTLNGVAFAGGMGEGGGEGKHLQEELAALCQQTGFNLCGPNCVGIINVVTPAISSFATVLYEFQSLRAGPISMVTQSGGIGTAAFSLVQQAGFGFRHLISSGNEAVITFADYLHALARDEGTRIIAGYLEGVEDGPKFVRALAEARAQGKPVVLIKSGATAASARAARAHTGSLVGEDRVFDAVVREMGVIRVSSVEELVDVCLVLAGTPSTKIPCGPGVGVVTFGGGNGVLAADQCVHYGLTTPTLDDARRDELQPLLLTVASAANPMDLTPSTAFRAESLAKLPEAMDVLASQLDIHSLVLIVGGLAVKEKEVSTVFTDFWRRCPKAVSVAWPAPPTGTIARFAGSGIAVFEEPDRALRVLGRLAAYGAALTCPRRDPSIEPLAFDWTKHVHRGEVVVCEDRCHTIMREAGISVAAGELATDEAAALRIGGEIGPPVVMKGISPRVTHRAAAGLLAVDLRTPEDITEAFRRLRDRAAAIGVALDGIYVQRMARGGVELLVSVFRDPLFGTMISVGSGGGMTELLDDVVTERAPVDPAVAATMLRRLRLSGGFKDQQGPLDTAEPAAFISRLSELGAGAPWARFTFEVNPIKWQRDGVIAVDGLLVVDEV